MNALKQSGLVLFLGLTACTTHNSFVQSEPTAPSSTQTESVETKAPAENKRDAQEKSPSSWELSGAMAARNSSKSWTASVNWLQRGPGAYQIRLNGPLGSGSILIEKHGSVISYRDGPKSVSSHNADELLKQQTGMRLPVSSLYYWVRGVPAPGKVDAIQRHGDQITTLRQSGYTIQYARYSKTGHSVLPGLVILKGNGLLIRMVIRQWKV